MASTVNQSRYPKRKRVDVNYEIDLSIDGDLDLEDDGNVSEELGEDDSSSADPTSVQQHNAVSIVEDDSEFEDASFGSRKILKKVGRTLPPSKFHNSLTPNSVKS